LQSQGIHYWALGGRAERTTLFKSPGIAHYPGTPQGRSPAESGAHGCTLVHVDDQGRAEMTSITADAMEWLHETILVDPAMRREGLEATFTQRIRSLTQGLRCDLLVTWTIGGSGPLMAELRRGKLRGDLLEWLRIEHGLSSPVVWTVGIELETQNALPASLYEQETILGDFLRAVREFELDPQQPLEVASLLAEGQAAGLFSQAVRIADAATRRRVLHEAALLAVELLGGDTT
jgi:DNA repair exonuclease SbcCD nuclease subunit